MRRARTLPILTGVFCLAGALAAQPAQQPPGAKLPYQRLLRGADVWKAAQLLVRLQECQKSGRFEDALKAARALAELRVKAQGADHWQTASTRWDIEALRRVLRYAKARQQEYAGGFALLQDGAVLMQKGRYREAVPKFEKVLAVRRELLGDDHPDTATARSILASCLAYQGQYALAEAGDRTALAIRRKALGDEHPDTARSCLNLAAALRSQGKYAPAEEWDRKALLVFRKTLGDDDPDTARAYATLAADLGHQGRFADAEPLGRKALSIRRQVFGENHPDTARSYENLAVNLAEQGAFADAVALCRKALAIRRRVLGEDHPDTALTYASVASNLSSQGEDVQAEECYHKALSIWRKTAGQDHPSTAAFYFNMARNYQGQGRFDRAEGLYRKALVIFRKALGEEHPHTALGYAQLAEILGSQGQYAQAGLLFRKALAIHRKGLGEEHPSTARDYTMLAWNLGRQGQYAQAEALCRKALAIFRNVLGEEHPSTPAAYSTLATNLEAQGKYADAEINYREALAISRKAMGEEHANTAGLYANLATVLHAQGQHAQAEALCRKALAIQRQRRGEGHPDTAVSYTNLATILSKQGKHAEAEKAYRKALAIQRTLWREAHLHTALSYTNLAMVLYAQGNYAEAETLARAAVAGFAAARLRLATTGLDRATSTTQLSPLNVLALLLARNGKPEEAWQRYEEGLARGTWDDLSARLRLPPAEQQRQAALLARLDHRDRLIERAAALKEPTPAQDRRRKDLLSEQLKLRDQLGAFTRQLEETYGPAAGQVFPRAKIQAALPADVALVGWLDVPGRPGVADPNGEHWAVLLRAAGPPVWVRLRGSGPGGAWTDADTKLPYDLYATLRSPRGVWQPLARRLRAQRLEPLLTHLKAKEGVPAVRRLIVLPSVALPGLPVEVIAEEYTVSYAPSATLFAHLRGQPKLTTKGLLAVADPVFDLSPEQAKAAPLPPGGALLTLVSPGSNAAAAGLRPNDVLLRYDGTDLAGPNDLLRLTRIAGTNPVLVAVWRDGRTLSRQVRPGALGAVLAAKPAPQALDEQRCLDRRLAIAVRGGDETWPPLPGTRVEAEALRRLFDAAGAPVKLLTDSEASEQRLDELARGGELGKYRYLHLATHGEADGRARLRSAILLARDRLPDPDKQMEAGRPVYDGRLTAAEVLAGWHLHSELVTLSACQTALGKYEGGEGFMGFSQALLLAGSRAVCLSQWKVDDGATALLMDRFYQNLLGKRSGLKGPLGKAAALREAQAWLRALPRAEALRRVARLSGGVARGKGRPAPPLLPVVPRAPAGAADADRPYAHPYYWAAFVLIGDPD